MLKRVENIWPGDTHVYHRGYLLKDREDDKHLAYIADYYEFMALMGVGFLTQKKVVEGTYVYRFTKAKGSFKYDELHFRRGETIAKTRAR